MNRSDIARTANAAARESRRPGAPALSESSDLPNLLDWLAWNDPNGEWSQGCYLDGDIDAAGFTTDDAWNEIRHMVEDNEIVGSS